MANKIKLILKYIVKAYYRLFYFFFRIEKRSDSGSRSSDFFCAIGALVPLIYLGFMDLMFIEYLFSKFIYNLNIMHYKVNAILIALVLTVLNGLLFFHKKRYLKIKEMFSREDDNTRSIRSFYCILYSLVTMFGTIILVEILGRPT